MHFVLDIGVIIIMVLSIVLCYRKGIIHTLMGFAGNILSMIGAIYLGDLISNGIYDNILKRQIIVSISDSLKNSTYDGITSLEKAIDKLPSLPTSLLDVFGYTSKTVANQVGGDLNTQINEIAKGIERILHPICLIIINFIVVSILFILFRIAVHFIIKLIDNVANFPVIKTVNKVLGGVFGVVDGLLLVYFAAGIISLIIPFMSGSMTYSDFDKIALDSNFFSFFYQDNIIRNWFM